jgi:hypothetical protein
MTDPRGQFIVALHLLQEKLFQRGHFPFQSGKAGGLRIRSMGRA